jgi:hypothetical protein
MNRRQIADALAATGVFLDSNKKSAAGHVVSLSRVRADLEAPEVAKRFGPGALVRLPELRHAA